MRGVEDLRRKETDRITAVATGLRACGVEVEEEMDGLIVRGRGRPPRGGAAVETHGDHRLAMAFSVLGLGAEAAVAVDRAEMVDTSFPGFLALMSGLGADITAQ
jgi:3-phosphoshikimate 1-carboxyvinyltransferase